LAQRGFPWGRLVFFVTSNLHKFDEARKTLSECGIAMAMLRMKAPEIQDDNSEIIAMSCALDAAKRSHLPVIVEDAGLYIDALNGFPGPYSEHAFRTIGKEGILKLLEKRQDRRAFFRSVVAFCGPQRDLRCFQGVVEGRITTEIKGSLGFGFDPIFAPSETTGKTFGEMTASEKGRISHRARALREFAEWYKQGPFSSRSVRRPVPRT